MHPVLKKAQAKGADFASLRHEKSDVLAIAANEYVVKIDGAASSSDYMLRMLVDGGFIYRFTTREPTVSDLNRTFGLKIMFGVDKMPHMPALRGSDVLEPTGNFNKAPEDKLNEVRALRDLIVQSNQQIRSINIGYQELLTRKEYMDTNGREITVVQPNSVLFLDATAGGQSNRVTAHASASTTLGYVFDFVAVEKIRDEINRRLNAQLNGVSIKSGVYPAVMGPSAVGTLAHEGLGHCAEADGATKGLLYKLRGKKIADSAVSIVDAPKVDTPLSNCRMKYDDEGTLASPVRIIDKGVVRGFMTDLLYSKRLKLPASGNARAQDATAPHLIRMRNTYAEPGNMTVEELVKSIKSGYLITSAPTGETNPADGVFQFGIEEGYKIVKGEIVASLKPGASISGYTIETLASVDGVANDFQMDTGTCGKWLQSVPVASGGPHVRVRALKVG